MATSSHVVEWDTSFLNPQTPNPTDAHRALIILNQPFSLALFDTLWRASTWRCCADGGANRLYDLFEETNDGDGDGDALRALYMPDLIKGDLDSLRDDVRAYYAAKGVTVLRDANQDTTDLVKCIESLQERERATGYQHDTVFLGGLSGRLDQTVHVLSYVHKMRTTRPRAHVVTDDNVAWVLDGGRHRITIDHDVLGPTCGLLPVGIESTVLTTSGLRWNLNGAESSFDGLMSTSNHLIPTERCVTIDTSRPIWWCAELRKKV